MRVLDVGCGTGEDVRAIASIVGGTGEVVGIDPSGAMIDEAIARGVPQNAQFVVGSAHELEFADASFDAVRADRVFQHLREQQTAACELKRVLKHGGSALLLDQDWGSLMIAGAEQTTTQRIIASFQERLANPWAGRNARGLLRRTGFSDVAFLPMVAVPPFAVAFENILKPAIDAALRGGALDAQQIEGWRKALVDAEQRNEFLCAVVVIVAMGRVGMEHDA